MLCNYDTGILASSNSNTSSVSISSPVWTVGANMTTPRTDFTGTALNQNVYIIGEFTKDGNTTDIVEFYDPNTDTWDDAAPLPEPLDHPPCGYTQ
jgi:Kelch motif